MSERVTIRPPGWGPERALEQYLVVRPFDRPDMVERFVRASPEAETVRPPQEGADQ